MRLKCCKVKFSQDRYFYAAFEAGKNILIQSETERASERERDTERETETETGRDKDRDRQS